MDGEVKLPETIWLIWVKDDDREGGLFAIDESGDPRLYCTSEDDAMACIASQMKNYDFPPGDLIPVEVRITRAQEAGS